MKIVLCGFGTEGPLRNILALSLALRSAGHEPIVCAPPDFSHLFSRQEIPFCPVGFDFRKMMEEESKKINPVKFIGVINNFAFNYVQAQFNGVLETARKGADLIIAIGLDYSGRSVADYLKIPYRYISNLPTFYESKEHVPLMFPFPKLPKSVNYVLWKLSNFSLGLYFGNKINKVRQLHQMEKVADLNKYLTDDSILCEDNHLVQMPADVGVKYTQIPYLHLKEENELDAGLVKFIEKGPAPIYIGFGSMTDGAPEKTKEILQKLIDQRRFRMVISKGWAKLGLDNRDQNVFFVDNVPHLKLFPKMSIIIHHGGAGTFNAAAWSGISQIIVPHIIDQFYWGRRSYELKIGPKPIPRTRLSFRNLLGAIEEVSSNKDIQNNAKILAEKLQKRDGIREAIAIIEKIE